MVNYASLVTILSEKGTLKKLCYIEVIFFFPVTRNEMYLVPVKDKFWLNDWVKYLVTQMGHNSSTFNLK